MMAQQEAISVGLVLTHWRRLEIDPPGQQNQVLACSAPITSLWG